MIIRLIKNNRIYNSIPIIILVSILLGFYNFSTLTKYEIANLSLGHYIIYNFGYLDPYSIKFLIPVIIWLFPLLFLIHLVGNSIYNDSQKKLIYIFTRTDKRTKWFIRQTANLFLNVLFFFGIYFLSTIIVGLINKLGIYSTKDVLIILLVFLVLVLGSFLLLLLINLLSFYMKITYSYIVVLSIFIFLIMTTGMIFEFFSSFVDSIKWLPTSHFVMSWYDNNLLVEIQNELYINHIEGFNLKFVILYYLIFLLMIMFLSLRKINKADIL